MRTWKIIRVPFWRIGGRGEEEEDSVPGCERMVTRGTKEFQSGHVEVFVRADQVFEDGAEMVVEEPRWRVAEV
jgi:hypothetical protein